MPFRRYATVGAAIGPRTSHGALLAATRLSGTKKTLAADHNPQTGFRMTRPAAPGRASAGWRAVGGVLIGGYFRTHP
jgi:hypothetical protein